MPVKKISNAVASGNTKSPATTHWPHVGGQSNTTVSVAVGKTFNIGDYETVRVDVSRTYPVGTGESADRIHAECLQDTLEAFKSMSEEVLQALRN